MLPTLIAVAVLAYVAWREGLVANLGPNTLGSPLANGASISVAPSLVPAKTTVVTTTPMACSATVASELTADTGIVTPVSDTLFDTLPGAGAVTVGGQPATSGYNPQNPFGTSQAALATSTKLAATAVGMTAALGSIVSGGSAAFAATALGSIIPFVGIGVAVLSTVVAMINQHHQIALANEGRVLSSTDPNAISAFVLVIQGVINGEIISVDEASTYTSTIVSDWYAQVKNIQRGTWPYLSTPAQDPTWPAMYGGKWTGPYAAGWSNGSGSFPPNSVPSVCNAACEIGHMWIERGQALTLAAVADILAGNHNIVTFPLLPPYTTQTGVAQVEVLY